MTDCMKSVLSRVGLIILLVVLVYGNTLNHGFVWDDNDVIVNSPLTRSLANIPQLFISEDSTDGSPTGYYRPVTYISFTVDRAIWGLNPVGFNITNLLLHLAACVLFYRVVAALFNRENLAFTAALIFALHPIVGETVNFHAGGRNTLLSACFALGSLLCYVRNRKAASIACFALAIFSKEFALLLPAVFLFYDAMIRKEIDWKRFIPYGVATFCYLFLRSVSVTSKGLLQTVNISGKFMLIPKIAMSYLVNMVDPLQLKSIYDISNIVSWPEFAGYSVALFALIGIAIYFRDRKEIALAILLSLLFLAPVCNILPLGASKIADRHGYFPLMGFSLALAYLLCLCKKQGAIPVMVALCAFYISTDIRRNDIWTDNDHLFTQMIKDAPDRYIGYQVMGNKLFQNKEYDQAEKLLMTAATKKDCPPKNMIGVAWGMYEIGREDKSVLFLEKAIEVEPENPEPYVMASRFYGDMGDAQKSGMYRQKALTLDPAAFDRMKERAVGACRHGEDLMAAHDPQARQFIQDALNLDPTMVAPWIDMGNIVAQKGDLAGAVKYLAKAAVLDPNNAAVHYNLAQIYETLGKKDEARDEMNRYKALDKGSKHGGDVSSR